MGARCGDLNDTFGVPCTLYKGHEEAERAHYNEDLGIFW